MNCECIAKCSMWRWKTEMIWPIGHWNVKKDNAKYQGNRTNELIVYNGGKNNLKWISFHTKSICTENWIIDSMIVNSLFDFLCLSLLETAFSLFQKCYQRRKHENKMILNQRPFWCIHFGFSCALCIKFVRDGRVVTLLLVFSFDSFFSTNTLVAAKWLTPFESLWNYYYYCTKEEENKSE